MKHGVDDGGRRHEIVPYSVLWTNWYFPRAVPACWRRRRLVQYAAMKLLLNLSLAAALVVLTGCGSISSRWRGDRGAAYPGVKLATESGTHYSTEGEWISFFDIPLSAVVDTLFLPYDLAKTSSATPDSTASGAPPAESGAASSERNVHKAAFSGSYLHHARVP